MFNCVPSGIFHSHHLRLYALTNTGESNDGPGVEVSKIYDSFLPAVVETEVPTTPIGNGRARSSGKVNSAIASHNFGREDQSATAV